MTPVRIGLLRLSDSAPMVLAAARGLFAAHGLDATLGVEPSWANIADKLAYGQLDAAVMLPPLALAARARLRGPETRVVVPMGLSTGGNTVVLAHDIAQEIAPDACDALGTGRRFAAWLARRAAPPRLAVVHDFSTHNLLLRYWLAASGADPDRAIETVIVPPAQVVEALAEGRIAGFCAGAPWGDVAAAGGAGAVLFGTSAIWAGHPEKCLAVSEDWIGRHPAALTKLLRAVLHAQRLCDDPAEAPALARLLEGGLLALPPGSTSAALPGGAGAERIRFHAGAAWCPFPAHAAWFAGQMRRWGWLGADLAARDLYRPDLLAPAARAEGLAWPALPAEQFCDGGQFDAGEEIGALVKA
ncbi:MAG: ABC transporter substrate-binding protein [Rhodospirillales bacterium]|nr:ABC transporter substrate-binding protein [Rhodospirillales bacterium]